MLRSFAKRLRRPKQNLLGWLYPLQRRLPISLSREASRVAIVMVDPSAKHGGWVDRLKGIISVYELATLTGRAFKLYAGDSFPIAEFLEPATTSWRGDQANLSWNPLVARFHVSRDTPSSAFARLRRTQAPKLYIETNLDYLAAMHPELSAAQCQALWGQRYRELFRPSSSFEKEVMSHACKDAVAVHARFTGLLGDFKDVVANALAPTARDELLQTCVTRIRDIARTNAPGPVMVFSDSTRFLDAASASASNIVVLPGIPMHIDHTDKPRESLHKTLLDFYVMLRCREIVQLRIGPMYPSAFSRYASYISGAPFNELR